MTKFDTTMMRKDIVNKKSKNLFRFYKHLKHSSITKQVANAVVFKKIMNINILFFNKLVSTN